MNIPESINNLTEEKINDVFLSAPKETKADIDEIIFFIKQKIKPEHLKLFDEGVAYYKAGNTERSVIRGIISLYCDTIIKLLRKSSVDDKFKINIISNFENTTKTLAQLFDYQQVLLNNINQNKKIIDATEISYIMLGYAIETLRKLHNTQP